MYEISYHLAFKGKIINPGTMIGPWLPIYGWGGILVFFLSKKFKRSPAKVFIISFISCGIIEYVTSFYLEKIYNLKWWDYSNFMFNINGRICLSGLLAFSMLSLIVMYFVIPILDRIYLKFNGKIFKYILAIILFIFFVDFIYSSFNPNISNAFSTI